MPTTMLTPGDLFADMRQQTFDDYEAFERSFIACFNARRFELPPGYSWRDALEWGLRKQLVRRQGDRIVIER